VKGFQFLIDEKKIVGAVEKTRTSTGCPTATSTLRVYQFRHDRTSRGAGKTGSRHVANRFRRNKYKGGFIPTLCDTAAELRQSGLRRRIWVAVRKH
jgi:hypothetical protein